MSERFTALSKAVDDLYAAKKIGRADWADWLASNHIWPVAIAAKEIAIRFGADPELAMAGGVLHDIADTVMSRFDKTHEAVSLQMAHDLMRQAGYSDEEVAVVVDDGIRLHSCHGGRQPRTIVGKCIASGDAIAHLKTDFYQFARTTMLEDEHKTLEQINAWAVAKLNRDYHDKLCFQELKHELKSDFDRQLARFS